MIKKTVLALSVLTLISFNNATAADKDDDASYQAAFLVKQKPSIEFAQADLPLSLKYERQMQQKRQQRLAGTVSSAPMAQPAPIEFSDAKPVMIIRFNQPNVYFQTPLYNVVKKTLEIKPDASFEIQSLIPSTGDEKADIDNKKTAIENGQKIVSSMTGIGLPQNRIRMSYTGSNNVSANEVQLFVR